MIKKAEKKGTNIFLYTEKKDKRIKMRKFIIFDVLIINLSTIFFINSSLIKYQNGPRPSKPLKV